MQESCIVLHESCTILKESCMVLLEIWLGLAILHGLARIVPAVLLRSCKNPERILHGLTRILLIQESWTALQVSCKKLARSCKNLARIWHSLARILLGLHGLARILLGHARISSCKNPERISSVLQESCTFLLESC